MSPSSAPRLNIQVSASLVANKVEIEVTANKIVMTQLGPNGGRGQTIEILVRDWDVLSETVKEVRQAIANAQVTIGETMRVSS